MLSWIARGEIKRGAVKLRLKTIVLEVTEANYQVKLREVSPGSI